MAQSRTVTQFKRYDIILALFVAVIIISNVVTTKLISVGSVTFAGGAVLFPLAYIFGDIFTEVYGYKQARKAIWTGFAALVFLTLALLLVEYLPAAPFWTHQDAYQAILGFVPRIVVASICGYLAGEFVNAITMAVMKVRTKGRHLWSRTIGSTITGEGADTIVFNIVAFYGVLSAHNLVKLAVTAYLIKVAIEVIFTPVTYMVVNRLKRLEGTDPFDKNIDFNPFAAEEGSKV